MKTLIDSKGNTITSGVHLVKVEDDGILYKAGSLNEMHNSVFLVGTDSFVVEGGAISAKLVEVVTEENNPSKFV